MSINYITLIEESVILDKRPSMFDRLTDPTSDTSVFDRLVKSTPRMLVFNYFGPIKKNRKHKGNHGRMGEHVYAQEHNPSKNCSSLIPSRMRRETKFVVSCREVLRAKTYTIVHTRKRDEDEESLGSSYYITICDKKNVLHLT